MARLIYTGRAIFLTPDPDFPHSGLANGASRSCKSEVLPLTSPEDPLPVSRWCNLSVTVTFLHRTSNSPERLIARSASARNTGPWNTERVFTTAKPVQGRGPRRPVVSPCLPRHTPTPTSSYNSCVTNNKENKCNNRLKIRARYSEQQVIVVKIHDARLVQSKTNIGNTTIHVNTVRLVSVSQRLRA